MEFSHEGDPQRTADRDSVLGRRDLAAAVKDRAFVVGFIVLALWGIITHVQKADAVERAESAEDSVLVLSGALKPLQDAETALRDSVAASDSTVQAVRDSVAEIIAGSDTVLQVKLDTLEILVEDPEALRIIAERDSVHALRLASKDSVIATQDTQIQQQRHLLATRGQIIANLELQVDQLQSANQALRDALRSKGRSQWVERGVVVLAACAMLCR